MAYKQLKLWFDNDLAELLCDKILSIESNFNHLAFKKNVDNKIHTLELKDRIEVFAENLFLAFDKDFLFAIQTLVKILGPENENETGMFKLYYWIQPIAKMVEKYGQSEFKASMQAIEEITKRSTGEYAIRPFIINQQDETLKQMTNWSLDKNSHVRRLASEGLRPRLPWATKLDTFIDNPNPIIPILSNLKSDKSKYVQKSVANCINDLLKDNLDIGRNLIEEWITTSTTSQTKWIIKHSIRNLLKTNDSWAADIKAKLES